LLHYPTFITPPVKKTKNDLILSFYNLIAIANFLAISFNMFTLNPKAAKGMAPGRQRISSAKRYVAPIRQKRYTA
jgi:hypothetical protein